MIMPEPKFPIIGPEIKKNIQESVQLREDIMPINRQIVNINESDVELESIQEQMEEDEAVVHWVDFEGGDLDEMKKNGFKHDGISSYLISPISERDWFSDHYFDCTAAVVIGRDANTGREISFLSHQDPNYFVDGGEAKAKKFSQEMSDSLEELKARSEEGTVEVSFLGGNFSTTTQDEKYQHHHYKKSIETLRQIVQDSLGFDPRVLTGPNNNIGSETVITVETQKRKAWVERSKQADEFNQVYQANMIDEEEKKWIESGNI